MPRSATPTPCSAGSGVPSRKSHPDSPTSPTTLTSSPSSRTRGGSNSSPLSRSNSVAGETFHRPPSTLHPNVSAHTLGGRWKVEGGRFLLSHLPLSYG